MADKHYQRALEQVADLKSRLLAAERERDALAERVEVERRQIEDYDPSAGPSPGPLWTGAMNAAQDQVLEMLDRISPRTKIS
jgi:hypothetical protein